MNSLEQPQSKQLSYAQRAALCANPASKELLRIMEEKKSNLIASLDVATKKELLSLAKSLSPHVCAIKTHIDMIEDFDAPLLLELQELSQKGGFILIEDRKFADIGKTAKCQYEGGIYKISSWAHLVTAQSIPGPGLIEGLKKTGAGCGRGMLLIAEMSSQGSLASGAYTEATVRMAEQYKDFVIGFISQRRVSDKPYFLHLTPGVSLVDDRGSFGQQYRTPEQAVYRDGCDAIIVGSALLEAEDTIAAAIKHKRAGWEAYEAIGLK